MTGKLTHGPRSCRLQYGSPLLVQYQVGKKVMTNLILCVSVVLFMGLVSGCVSMAKKLNSWIGYPIDDAVAYMGPPDSSLQRCDGGTTYTWTTIDSYSGPGPITCGVHGTTYCDTSMYPGGWGSNQCNSSLITDSSGKIVSWAYRGHCYDSLLYDQGIYGWKNRKKADPDFMPPSEWRKRLSCE